MENECGWNENVEFTSDVVIKRKKWLHPGEVRIGPSRIKMRWIVWDITATNSHLMCLEGVIWSMLKVLKE